MAETAAPYEAPPYALPYGHTDETWPRPTINLADLDPDDQEFLRSMMGFDVHMPNADAEAQKREVTVAGEIGSFGGSYGDEGANIIGRWGFLAVDAEGTEYVDLEQMILCMMMGHGNPDIERLVRIFETIYPNVFMGTTVENNEPLNALCSLLKKTMKPYGDFRTLLASTGTSANNQAIRLLMGALGGEKHTQLVTIGGGYNGADLKMNAECAVDGWTGITSLDAQAMKIERDGSDLDAKIAEIESNAKQGIKPILLIEDGIQGVGGFHAYDKKFMRKLIRAVKRLGGKVILDNVQAFVRNGQGLIGLDVWGRDKSGKLIKDFKPDAITLAKGLGNGRQIAATMVTEETLRELAAHSEEGIGSSFDTFSITPAAVAAAIVTIREAVGKKLWNNAKTQGDLFRERLDAICESYPDVIEETTGIGALVGLKLKTKKLAARAMVICKEYGILIAKGGAEGRTLRLPLPANATPALVEEAAERMGRLIDELDRLKDDFDYIDSADTMYISGHPDHPAGEYYMKRSRGVHTPDFERGLVEAV